MKGIFELKSAADLIKKLRYEYDQLESDPDNPYIAFNFFVTAEHIPDWLFPKKANKDKREQLRNNSLLLQICSHIANGAKHFEVEASHHKSVSGLRRLGGYFPKGYWPKNYFPRGYFPESRLVIQLEGDAKAKFGDSINVLGFASKLLDYWEAY
jgi:hypothetical protein